MDIKLNKEWQQKMAELRQIGEKLTPYRKPSTGRMFPWKFSSRRSRPKFTFISEPDSRAFFIHGVAASLWQMKDRAGS